MKLGEFLQLCREINGLTLREVESQTGLSNAYLSQIENGKIKDVGFSKIILLAELYNVTLDRVSCYAKTPQAECAESEER